MKVFIPRWTLLVIGPILLVVWGVVTWLALMTEDGRQELGIVGWIGLTLVLLLVGGMLWLMTGRLPAYVIEIEDEEPRRKA
jgi:hypothetical protein